MIEIPKTISDVTPALCRQAFTEICGGTVNVYGKGKLDRWNYVFIDDDASLLLFKYFNPFTRIQDTKLCDPWIENNELSMTINKEPDAVNGEYLFETLIHNDIDYREINIQVFHESEPFARMVAIIKAFNKMEEDKK